MHEGQKASETPDDGRRRDEPTNSWQEALDRKRARELDRERAEERNRARIAAAWKPFIQTERRELELRKDGQLAKLLGDPLPGEPPEALRRLLPREKPGTFREIRREWRPGDRRCEPGLWGRLTELPLPDPTTCPSAP